MRGEFLELFPRRRFTPADAGILLAAVVIGVVLGGVHESMLSRAAPAPGIAAGLTTLAYVGQALMIAVLPLRLRKPRPDREEWAIQPGVAVSLAASAMIAVRLVGNFGFLLAVALRGPDRFLMGRASLLQLLNQVASPLDTAGAIATAWALLYLGGHWRKPDDWVDRFGRFLGLACLALVLSSGTFGVFWLFL